MAFIPLVLIVLVAVVLQHMWMQRVRQRDNTDWISDSNPFARKVQEMLLRQKGLWEEEPGEAAAGGKSPVQNKTCPYCVGTGAMATEDGHAAICRACKGVGYHAVRYFTGKEWLCPACSGMGQVQMEDGGFASCPRCEGRGLIDPPAPAAAPQEEP